MFRYLFLSCMDAQSWLGLFMSMWLSETCRYYNLSVFPQNPYVKDQFLHDMQQRTGFQFSHLHSQSYISSKVKTSLLCNYEYFRSYQRHQTLSIPYFTDASAQIYENWHLIWSMDIFQRELVPPLPTLFPSDILNQLYKNLFRIDEQAK